MTFCVNGLTGLALVAVFLWPAHTYAQQPPGSTGSDGHGGSSPLRQPATDWLIPTGSQGAANSPPPPGTAGNGEQNPAVAPGAPPAGAPKTAPVTDAKAEFHQGLQYLVGHGVPQDDKAAARLFRLAAEQGYAPAQVDLGTLYDRGQGVPQDFKEAAHWYRLAAEQGDAWAQYGLGFHYFHGEGVPQDYKEAAHWYRLAAAQGNASAQSGLGYLYDAGQGVQRDYKEAAHWYRLAAEQGQMKAEVNLGRLYGLGLGVAKDEKEAMHWYRLAAEQGDAVAERVLGVHYLRGLGVPQDYKESLRWFRQAAEQGDAGGQLALGLDYDYGAGVPKDYVAAYQWLNLAATADDRKISDNAARERDRIASLMTPGQIAEGQRLSAQWHPHHPGGDPPEPQEAPSAANGAPAHEAGDVTFGSGFFIAGDGRVLTNAHVVANCTSIRVTASPASALPENPSAAGGGDARVLGRDVTNDLALLATSLHPGAVPGWRFSVRQGEDIAIYGFPLAGLLASGGSIATGTIAALSGVDQDSRELQITAPIQAGNSGGPVFDRSGNVVGIVVAKLDALKLALAVQDIPENVGFAIKASVVRDFLETTMPLPQAAPATVPLTTPDLTVLARQITVQVVCRQ